jgi:nicotinate-nucleotide adenylyltransferase
MDLSPVAGQRQGMRIGILGGTFNPIHYGHLRIAEEAREALSLSRVLFMPTSVTPHKTDGAAAPGPERLEMVRLATTDNPGFEPSEVEIKRGGTSYTVDTARGLAGHYPEGTRLSLIVGNDAFNDIASWREHETLITLVDFIVVPRPGHPPKKPAEALPVELARRFWYDSDSGAYMNAWGRSVVYLDTTLIAISSSDIRRRIGEGLSIRYLTPPAVRDYIVTRGLYGKQIG